MEKVELIHEKCKYESGKEEKYDKVLDCISLLPEEMKLEILKRMSLDDLLNLRLSLNFLRLVLPVPSNVEFEPWLGKYLARLNRGYIFIPTKNRLFMTNQNDGDRDENSYYEDDINDEYEEKENCNVDNFRTYEHDAKGYEVSNITPCLEPGIYKIKVLQGGFDLVQVGYDFISSQCGPLECFHKEKQSDWPSSFISRGFRIQTEDRSDLACGHWMPWRSWKLPKNKMRGVIKDEAFFICTKDRFWKKSWTQQVLNPYTVDHGSWERQELLDYLGGEPLEHNLSILKGKDDEVFGYSISGKHLKSYDPQDLHSSFGNYEFSVSRYGYAGGKNTVGFILTGAPDMYGKPSIRLDWKEDFPDKEDYRNKTYFKRFFNPVSS